ncbi:MAG: rod shape-determining protein MreD [Sphingobacteriia bacterium]|nr:rod shape-determining protein MreD [Sphingobacteriia bacterium]NCC40162.1 rod shape-determining protein MreD [Gammaproteobacteria bacterium]
MNDRVQRGAWLIPVSLVLALLLMILPMPDSTAPFRPQWLALVTLYWCLMTPTRFGVFSAFAAGLTLDLISGSLLGQHALGLSVIAYATVELHQRARLFPLSQQTLFIWALLLVERLIHLWVLGATGQPLPSLIYWAPTLIGILLWPWLRAVLNDLSHRVGLL